MEASIATRNEQGKDDAARRADVGAELTEMIGGARRRMEVAEVVGPVITESEAARQAKMQRPIPLAAGFEGMGT